MKNNYLVYFLVLYFFSQNNITLIAQTNLTDGDIVFTRVNTDDNEFSFVTLVHIKAGTEFFITDEKWTSIGFGNDESTLKVSVLSDITPGEECHVNPNTSPIAFSFTSTNVDLINIESVGAYLPYPNKNMLGSAGDQLFIYQNNGTLNIIAGINANSGSENTSDNAWNTSTISTSKSQLPLGKNNASNGFIGLFPKNGINIEVNNARYKATAIHSGTKESIVSSIVDVNNWEFNNTDSFTPTYTNYSVITPNTPPIISLVNTTLNYTEGDSATQIDASGTISDPDGDADWDAGTLVAQITANGEPADELSISDTDGDGTAITISGINILANGTTVGTLSISGGIVTNSTALTITFDSDATNAIVQEVLQSLRYRNTSTTPGTSNRTITITANDTNGGTANDTRTVSVSSVAPEGYSVVIDQSPINAANDDAASFTFAGAEVGASYNYAFTSSGAPGSVTGSGTIATASDQITSIDISGLADGTITLNVTLTDINGNAGAAATDTETKETVAPTGYSVVIDQSPINAANDDAVSFTFAGAEVGASYNYAFTSSGAPGSVTGAGTIATATDQITSIDISGLADGTITLNVTLTDVNGNAGAADTDTETKERVAPIGYSVVIDQSPINAANDDAVSFTFAGAQVGATYNYALTSSGAPGSVTGSGTIATATDQITSIDLSALADGTITLNVTLTDVNGNTGTVATDTETKETIAPTGYSVAIDQSPINAANDDAASFTFAGAEVGATYNYAFTSSGAPGSVTGSGTIATATDQITSIDISGLADGTVTLSVMLTDVNGNTGVAATGTETKDASIPLAPTIITPAMAVTINTVTYTLEGTHTEDDVTVHAYIDTDNNGVADDNISLGSASVSGGNWSFDVNITTNTVHNFVVQAVDDAGNTSNDTDVPTITHDSTLSTNSITFNEKAMRVYPNPSNGIIQYSYNGNATINTIEVYNLQGKQILKQKANTTIDISTVANGIYFVKFNANEGSLVKRVIKNKF